MNAKCLLFFGLVVVAMPAIGAEPIEQSVRRIVDGATYRGIDFSSTLVETRKRLPHAFPNSIHPGTEQGILTFEVRDDPDRDCVLLRFKDGTLIELDMICLPSSVKKMGGVPALNAKAIEALGEPATKTDRTLLWDFPQINRMVVAYDANQRWSLNVYDRARRRAITDYKDTTAFAEAPGLQVAVGPPVAIQSGNSNSLTHAAATSTTTIPSPASIPDVDSILCPPEMRQRVFEFLREKVKRDHPFDYDTQRYVLMQQVESFQELQLMDTPEGMATSHFVALRRDAANRHPYDFRTQRYVLKNNIDNYLMRRLSGHDGSLIINSIINR